MDGALTEYIFNAAGQRVSIWDPVHRWEYAGQTYWGSKPVEFYASGYAQFQHQDWLGTQRVETNNTGAVQGTYTSLPYGDAYAVSGANGDANHFAQLDFDTESGTDHAQFRQYSPTEGRWLRPDPSGGSYDASNPQSMNRYVYAANNPLSNTDPSGLDWSPDEDGGDWSWNWGSSDAGGPSFFGVGPGSPGEPEGPGPGSNANPGIDCIPVSTLPGGVSNPILDASDLDGCQFVDESGAFNALGRAQQYSSLGQTNSNGPIESSSSTPNNIPSLPPRVCQFAAIYNALSNVKSATDAANKDMLNTLKTGGYLLPAATYAKYAMGAKLPTISLVQAYLAGAFAKTYMDTVPKWLGGLANAQSQYDADMKACGGS